jgi:hypothetical protein
LKPQGGSLRKEGRPRRDSVTFYVRTFDGILPADVAEDDLGRGNSPLTPLFYAGQTVITAIRETTQQQRG